MKRYAIFALALALGCTMFTGCRRMGSTTNTKPPATQAVTEMPTRPEPQTIPATMPTASTEATDATVPAADATEQGTNAATEGARSRSAAKQPAAR